jgi:hypothetical protein
MLIRIRTETYADPSIHFDPDPDPDPNPTPSFTIVQFTIFFFSFTIVEKSE